MKKLLLLFVAATLLSCSSDENESVTDPIVGEWTLHAKYLYENQELVTTLNYNETPCYGSVDIKYTTDNIYTENSYNGDCELSNSGNLFWTKVSDTRYLLYEDNPEESSVLRDNVQFYDGKMSYDMTTDVGKFTRYEYKKVN